MLIQNDRQCKAFYAIIMLDSKIKTARKASSTNALIHPSG